MERTKRKIYSKKNVGWKHSGTFGSWVGSVGMRTEIRWETTVGKYCHMGQVESSLEKN